ncbi:MAG: hypothetical protein VXW44_07665, partial [SAR324 cluster bacterium]|nr:hypothetical protein [SAR324 cluster bacterium]
RSYSFFLTINDFHPSNRLSIFMKKLLAMLLSVKRKQLSLWYSNKITLAGWNLSHCGFSKKINRNPRNKIAAASELYTTIALTILRIFGLIKTVSENMNFP